MRQVPLSPLSFDPQRVANVPEHPPPSTRLRSCAHIANRRLSRIIGARGRTLGAPILSQGTNQTKGRGSRAGFGASRSHRKRRIASIIVTMLAAPKRATNRRSPCPAARPQPSASQRRERGQLPHSWVHRECFHLTLDVATLGVVTQTASTHETQRNKK